MKTENNENEALNKTENNTQLPQSSVTPCSCPFCGGNPIFTRGCEHKFIGGYNVTIGLECEICPANMQTSFGNDGKIEVTEESAYKYLTDCWNSRNKA